MGVAKLAPLVRTADVGYLRTHGIAKGVSPSLGKQPAWAFRRWDQVQGLKAAVESKPNPRMRNSL